MLAKEGVIYKHCKGNHYIVLLVTKENVVYRSINSNEKVYLRPRKMWESLHSSEVDRFVEDHSPEIPQYVISDMLHRFKSELQYAVHTETGDIYVVDSKNQEIFLKEKMIEPKCETAVRLHIYFKGYFSEDEVYKKLEKALGETSFQIYETRTDEVE